MSKTNPKKNEWEQTLKNWESSGVSATAFCRKHKIALSTFNYWKDMIYPGNSKPKRSLFLEVKEDSSCSHAIELQIKDFTLQISQGFDEATLRRCLLVLRGF